MKHAILCLLLAASLGLARAQDDPRAATRDLLAKDDPNPGLLELHFLGAYEGAKWVGQVELGGTMASGSDLYELTNDVEVQVDKRRRVVKVEAKLRFDLTVESYRRVEEAHDLYVTRITEDTIRREGEEWVFRRSVSAGRRGVAPTVEEVRMPVAVGAIPEPLASLVPAMLAAEAPGRRFEFQLLSGPGTTASAEYLVVGQRGIGAGSRRVDALLVRLRQTVVEAAPSGAEKRRTELVDHYVSPEGRVLKIESPTRSMRYLAVEAEEIGKDLVLDFQGEADENGETPVQALLALFAAMEEEDADAIDARVDYEQFYYFAMQEQAAEILGEGGKHGSVKYPKSVLRQMWVDMGDVHIRAIRGKWFAKKEVPYGKDLEQKLETAIEGNQATVVRGGGIVRTWILSRERGAWKVVGYRE